MLLRIDPALNADVLHALRSMGHGDDLVVCDLNFPSDSIARRTACGRLLRMENLTCAQAVRAVLSVLPLDSFVDHPVERMEVVGDPHAVPEVQREVQVEVDAAAARDAGRASWPMGGIERFAFYERAKQAYAVLLTGERRFYGCFVIKKGVIAPEATSA